MAFRHLLVVDDLLEGLQLLREAAILASPAGGHVRLVSGPHPSGDGAGRAELSARLEERGALLRARGLHVTTGVLAAAGVDDIVGEATRAGSDIVLRRRRRRGRLEALAGRDADGLLLRRCPCPVWIVDDDRPPGGPVLAALELEGGDRAAALDAAVLETARLVAQGLATSLHVVHAWYAPLMPTLARVYVERRRNREVILAGAIAAAERLDASLGRAALTVPRGAIHVVRGEPSLVLAAIADRTGAQLLVMPEVSRHGWDAMRRSVAEHVLRHVRCSLLVIHPTARRQRVRAPLRAVSHRLRPVDR